MDAVGRGYIRRTAAAIGWVLVAVPISPAGAQAIADAAPEQPQPGSNPMEQTTAVRRSSSTTAAGGSDAGILVISGTAASLAEGRATTLTVDRQQVPGQPEIIVLRPSRREPAAGESRSAPRRTAPPGALVIRVSPQPGPPEARWQTLHPTGFFPFRHFPKRIERRSVDDPGAADAPLRGGPGAKSRTLRRTTR